MDVKRLARLFQLRKQANGLGKQVGGGGGTLSSASGYTTGADTANQTVQQPPDIPKPIAPVPGSALDYNAGHAPWNDPVKPKSPDVIPTNPQTGVPDKYYSLGTPGKTPEWAKPKEQVPAPAASSELQAAFDASDAARAKEQSDAQAAQVASANQLQSQNALLAKTSTSFGDRKPAASGLDDEEAPSAADAVATVKPPAYIQKIMDKADASEKPVPYTTPQSRITGTDEAGRPINITGAQMEARKSEVAQSLAPAPQPRNTAPQPQHTTTEAFGKTVPILSVSGNMKPPEPTRSPAPRPPVSMRTANRTAAALSSPQIKKRAFLREDEVRKFVEDVSTPATCLLVLCLDEWGTDMLDWEPETLPRAARMSWNAELPQANRDKIWALITHMTTDAFYSSLDGFIHICNALSGHGVDFEQFDPAEVDEMCWGVAETSLIAPMEKEDRFCEEIVAYMETRLEYEGFQKVPHMLKKFVQIPAREEELNQTLTSDGIGFKNYWKMQESRLANIDIWIKERLTALFTTLEVLPLRFANEQGLKRICERARSALGSQQALKSEVMAAAR